VHRWLPMPDILRPMRQEHYTTLHRPAEGCLGSRWRLERPRYTRASCSSAMLSAGKAITARETWSTRSEFTTLDCRACVPFCGTRAGGRMGLRRGLVGGGTPAKRGCHRQLAPGKFPGERSRGQPPARRSALQRGRQMGARPAKTHRVESAQPRLT